ncbi:hypothetical protein DCAR_0726807 [Daucus carota subsp. sativus]|uniref:Uncharacterized protein n=1 Tax=Daucus carota subsp. sativus TaxID=79200 RepID=A0A164SKC3_DAUCS|nr:hypothetical protein DCAR_0726807 [Daucus carota subsp. sativus]
MKFLFLVTVTMALIVFGAALTDAKRLDPFGEVPRSLVESDISPKVNIKVAETNEDEENESYGNFGHDKAGSSAESHRTFNCATISCN